MFIASNREAQKGDEEDQIQKNSLTAQQSPNMTLTKPVRSGGQDKIVQIELKEEEEEDSNIYKMSAMISKQNQVDDKKKVIKKRVKSTQKKKIIRTKFVSDSENNYIMHEFHHPESPLQDESNDNGDKIITNNLIPDYGVEQNILATYATSLIELNPIQTAKATSTATITTTSDTSTPVILTEEQMSNVDQHNVGEDDDDDDEDEEKEQSDNDDKVTTHNQLNHHHHLFNQQNRLRQASIGLEQRKHDMKITDAQLDRLTSLIKIIRNGNYNEFLEALESRGFKNLLNIFIDGQTVLHYSLIYGRSLAWCKQLVLNGANPNLTNRAGWHPIHLAAFNGSRETMRYLIDCIAN